MLPKRLYLILETYAAGREAPMRTLASAMPDLWKISPNDLDDLARMLWYAVDDPRIDKKTLTAIQPTKPVDAIRLLANLPIDQKQLISQRMLNAYNNPQLMETMITSGEPLETDEFLNLQETQYSTEAAQKDAHSEYDTAPEQETYEDYEGYRSDLQKAKQKEAEKLAQAIAQQTKQEQETIQQAAAALNELRKEAAEKTRQYEQETTQNLWKRVNTRSGKPSQPTTTSDNLEQQALKQRRQTIRKTRAPRRRQPTGIPSYMEAIVAFQTKNYPTDIVTYIAQYPHTYQKRELIATLLTQATLTDALFDACMQQIDTQQDRDTLTQLRNNQ